MSQLVHIRDLHIRLEVILGVDKVTEHETPEVILLHHSVFIHIQGLEELVKACLELLLGDCLEVFDEPLSVGVVHQAVVVDSHDLMDPETLEEVGLCKVVGQTEQDTWKKKTTCHLYYERS